MLSDRAKRALEFVCRSERELFLTTYDVYFDRPRLPWYALYVKHRHEKKVDRSLSAQAFHTFVPTYTKTHSNGSRFEIPLFPGYVFCRIDISKRLAVISTPGVFGIVCGGATPRSIPEEEIESVRKLLSTGLPVVTTEYFSPGQEIALNNGPFKGIQGLVVNATNERWLVVSIHMLQRSVMVKLDRQSVLAWT